MFEAVALTPCLPVVSRMIVEDGLEIVVLIDLLLGDQVVEVRQLQLHQLINLGSGGNGISSGKSD